MYAERCRTRTSNTRVSVFHNNFSSSTVLRTLKNTAYYNLKRFSTFLYDEYLGHTNCRLWRRIFATALGGPSSLLSNTHRGSLSGIKVSETSSSPHDTPKKLKKTWRRTSNTDGVMLNYQENNFAFTCIQKQNHLLL